jgi:hypothetical protein
MHRPARLFSEFFRFLGGFGLPTGHGSEDGRRSAVNDTTADAKEIFLEALECQTPDQLTRFLNEACAGYQTVWVCIESLFRAHQTTGRFGSASADAIPRRGQQLSAQRSSERFLTRWVSCRTVRQIRYL